jgi:hypothetical protein
VAVTIDQANNGLAATPSEPKVNTDPNAPPSLEQVLGTQFDLFDLPLIFTARDGTQLGEVWDIQEPTVLELQDMLRRDGKAVALEKALTQPIRRLSWSIESPAGAERAAWLTQQLEGIDIMSIVAQMTSAVVVRRTFHEKVWKTAETPFGTKFVYDAIAWRPPTTCHKLVDPRTDKDMGFRQEIISTQLQTPEAAAAADGGYVTIDRKYAVTYTHGAHRDPTNGVSDFDVAFWCYKQKQKIRYLWYTYLEGSALPRTVLRARSEPVGRKAVKAVAQLRSSGVVAIPNDWVDSIDTLDVSGKGGAEYKTALDDLAMEASQSVLAAFLELPRGAADNGTGSYALSADQSDFFVEMLEAEADAIARAVTNDILMDLECYNFPDAKRDDPTTRSTFKFGPIAEKDRTAVIDMFTRIAASVRGATNVPTQFMDQLTEQVANYLDMDVSAVSQGLADMAQLTQQLQAAQQVAEQQQLQNQANSVLQATVAQNVRQRAPGAPPPIVQPAGTGVGSSTTPVTVNTPSGGTRASSS